MRFTEVQLFLSSMLMLCQQFYAQEPEKCKADIVFVLDRSGSVRYYGYNNEKDFVKQVAASFKLDGGRATAGVVSFADSAKTEITCADHDNNADFNAAVDKMKPYDEYTNIKAGLRNARNLFKSSCNRNDAHKLCFLLTDGRANYEDYPYTMAKEVRDLDVRMFVVGIGAMVNPTELNKIAGDPEKVYYSRTFNQLITHEFVDKVLKKVCPPPTQPPTTTAPTTTPTTTVATPPRNNFPNDPTTPRAPEIECQGAPADVCLVLDMSGSVETEWHKTKDFAKQLVYAFDVKPDAINVGIVTFSRNAYTNLYLDECDSSACAVQKINAIGAAESSFTDLHLALTLARDDILWNSGRGANRVINGRDATQHVILISDGAASEFYEKDGTEAAEDIRRKGGEITVLAIGQDPRLELLKKIADGPENFKTAANFDQLLEPDFLAQFIREVCTEI